MNETKFSPKYSKRFFWLVSGKTANKKISHLKISLHDKHLWQTVADQEVAVSRMLTKAFL
jgi:hypothetical protein